MINNLSNAVLDFQDDEIGCSDEYIPTNKLFFLNFIDNDYISRDTGQDSKPQEGVYIHNIIEKREVFPGLRTIV